MERNVNRIMSLEVPLIVQLGGRSMSVGEVVAMIPGTIIELPKAADEELELLVNNKVVGLGIAVKVGENFGIRITAMGDARSRIQAMGGVSAAGAAPADGPAPVLAAAATPAQAAGAKA